MKNSLNASFAIWDDNKIIALRLTLAPGKWVKDFNGKISPKLWKVPEERVAYFKSLFVANKYDKSSKDQNKTDQKIELEYSHSDFGEVDIKDIPLSLIHI